MPKGDFGGKKHTLTKEDRIKGGKAQTDLQKLQTALAKRKYCKEDCPLYPCSVAVYSEIRGPNYGLCALKSLPVTVQRQVLNIIRGGKTGLIEAYSKVLGNVAVMSEAKFKNPSEQRRLMKDFQDFIRTVYGEKQTINTEQPLNIIVNFKKGVACEKKQEA